MERLNNRVGVICLAIAGGGYGIMAPLIRITNSIFPPFSSIAIRYIIVMVILFLSLKITHTLQLTIPRTRSDVIVLISVGMLGAGMSNVAFSLAVLTTTIGNAIFLFSLYAIFTPILGGITLHEWPAHGQWLALLTALVGTGFLFTPSLFGTIWGNTLAIIGALLASLQYVGTRKLSTYNATVISLYLAVGSIVVTLPFAFIIENWHANFISSSLTTTSYPVWLGWSALFVFAITNLIVNWLVSYGFKLVRSNFGGILLLLEPVIGLCIGIFFFSERPTPFSLLGATLILLGAISSIWIEGTKREKYRDSILS